MGLDYLPFAVEQAQRFWSKVDTSSGCWNWKASKDKDGYGKFSVSLPRLNGVQQQSHVRSHRLAYELTNGRIKPGYLVLHSCDNPSCCRPDHLRVGTQLENRADSMSRLRVAKGEHHPRAKLTEDNARELIALRGAGVPLKDLAAKFGIARCTVGQVGTIYWRHLG